MISMESWRFALIIVVIIINTILCCILFKLIVDFIRTFIDEKKRKERVIEQSLSSLKSGVDELFYLYHSLRDTHEKR